LLPSLFLSPIQPPPRSTLFPYTTLFRSLDKRLRERLDSAFTQDRLDENGGNLVQRGLRGLPIRRNIHIKKAHFRAQVRVRFTIRSEEHTSELQSRSDLVCRLLLEKKKNK